MRIILSRKGFDSASGWVPIATCRRAVAELIVKQPEVKPGGEGATPARRKWAGPWYEEPRDMRGRPTAKGQSRLTRDSSEERVCPKR